MTEARPAIDEPTGRREEQPGDGRLSRLALWLLRLSLVILLGLGLGLGVYFGVPALWRAAMEPIEANSARIADLEAEVQALREGQTRVGDASAAQLAGLEGRTAAQAEQLSEIESNLLELESRLREQAQQNETAEALSTELGSLQRELQLLERRLDILEEGSETPEAGVELERELQLLRVLDLIARARFEILLDNFGLARENMASAQEGLNALIEQEPAAEADGLRAAVERLALAQESLDQTPTLAANDLDSAWRLLLEATALNESGS